MSPYLTALFNKIHFLYIIFSHCCIFVCPPFLVSLVAFSFFSPYLQRSTLKIYKTLGCSHSSDFRFSSSLFYQKLLGNSLLKLEGDDRLDINCTMPLTDQVSGRINTNINVTMMLPRCSSVSDNWPKASSLPLWSVLSIRLCWSGLRRVYMLSMSSRIPWPTSPDWPPSSRSRSWRTLISFWWSLVSAYL